VPGSDRGSDGREERLHVEGLSGLGLEVSDLQELRVRLQRCLWCRELDDGDEVVASRGGPDRLDLAVEARDQVVDLVEYLLGFGQVLAPLVGELYERDVLPDLVRYATERRRGRACQVQTA